MTETSGIQVKGLNDVDFFPALWLGTNSSGIKAFGKNVVVKVDSAAQKRASGLITGTDQEMDKRTARSTAGCLVHVGAEAFRHFDDGTKWVGTKPKAGDRVFFEQYAGQLQPGIDGEIYRVMDYRSLAGCLDRSNPEVESVMRELDTAAAAAAGAIVQPADLLAAEGVQ